MAEARRGLRSGLFFLGLSIFVVWQSLKLGLGTLKEPGPGFVSLCAGLALGGLSVALLAKEWRRRTALEAHSGRVIAAAAALFAYSLVLESVGFYLATFVLVVILFHLGERRRRWWVLLAMSACLTLVVYVVFGKLLRVYFPVGFLSI